MEEQACSLHNGNDFVAAVDRFRWLAVCCISSSAKIRSHRSCRSWKVGWRRVAFRTVRYGIPGLVT